MTSTTPKPPSVQVGSADPDQPALDGGVDGRGTAVHAELVVDVGEVRLDGRLADEQLAADLPVRGAGGEQFEDLDLPLAQRDLRRPEARHQARGHRRGQYGLAGRRRTQRVEQLLGPGLRHRASATSAAWTTWNRSPRQAGMGSRMPPADRCGTRGLRIQLASSAPAAALRTAHGRIRATATSGWVASKASSMLSSAAFCRL